MNSRVLIAGVATSFALLSYGEQEQLFKKPNADRGYVAVVNQQSKVPQDELQAVVDGFREHQPLVFRFLQTPQDAKDATVIIRIVDTAGEPPMTVSPEVGRAEMNVAGLVADLKSESEKTRLLIGRARREFLRTIAYAFGVGGSQFSGNLMTAVQISDLDGMKEALPVDTIQNIITSAKRRGMKPEHIVDYYTACQEGWAPKPITAEQKKDWDAVHNPPSKPIKITYDKDKRKPVVK